MNDILTELGLIGDTDHPAASTENTEKLLRERITQLSVRSWENRIKWPDVEIWLDNFDGRAGYDPEVEKLHALFLLSRFMYFGGKEVRVLLRSIYREMVLCPFIQRARSKLSNSRDIDTIIPTLKSLLANTRILGIGNPSESGTHLLYFFRQENSLNKKNFMNASEIVSTTIRGDGTVLRRLSDPKITDYFFVDDICGSGETAVKFSDSVLKEIKTFPGASEVNFHYLSIFGTQAGMQEVRDNSLFGSNTRALYELDPTFQTLGSNSRFLKNLPKNIDASTVNNVATSYGQLVWPGASRGFDNNELILGFSHNTPDNTLPIFWGHCDHGSTIPWNPVFRRHLKYGY